MDETISKILDLMSSENIPIYLLTKKIGLNSNAITDWKSGKAKPSAEALSKIADYFSVSVDYLLGREEKEKTPFIPQNNPELQGIYFHLAKEAQNMELPEEDVQAILDFAKFLKSKNKE